MERSFSIWCVCKYYSISDSTHFIAEFISEADAMEYFNWRKRRFAAENKKRLVPYAFVWRLCQKTYNYADGSSSFRWFD